MAEVIQIDDNRLAVSLGRFRLSLEQNGELMQEIGMAQLVSVRRTFREEGVPAGSWVPLAASTIRSNPKIYGAGHKLLVRSGRLLNSIGVSQTRPGSVTLGTNVPYAAVHQFGSRDRGVGIGPRTKAQSEATVKVGEHSRLQSQFTGSRAGLQGPGFGTTRLEGPALEGKRAPSLRTRLVGPRNLVTEKIRRIGPRNLGHVAAHARHQNIPPRPYLVFRPEDPARIRGLVVRYVARARQQAGLGGGA